MPITNHFRANCCCSLSWKLFVLAHTRGGGNNTTQTVFLGTFAKWTGSETDRKERRRCGVICSGALMAKATTLAPPPLSLSRNEEERLNPSAAGDRTERKGGRRRGKVVSGKSFPLLLSSLFLRVPYFAPIILSHRQLDEKESPGTLKQMLKRFPCDHHLLIGWPIFRPLRKCLSMPISAHRYSSPPFARECPKHSNLSDRGRARGRRKGRIFSENLSVSIT